MEDLYDEDFEDATVSPAPSHIVPEATASAKNSVDISQNDIYSSAPSISIEPVGAETTQANDLYDDDFCSPGPSCILKTDLSLSSNELIAPVDLTENVTKCSDADKFLMPSEGVPANNGEESLYYEDDFALSTDFVEGADLSTPTENVAIDLKKDEERPNTERDSYHSIDNHASNKGGATEFPGVEEVSVPALTDYVTQEPETQIVSARSEQTKQTPTTPVELVAAKDSRIARDGDVPDLSTEGSLCAASQDVPLSSELPLSKQVSKLEDKEDVYDVNLNEEDFDIPTSEKAAVLKDEVVTAPAPIEEEGSFVPRQGSGNKEICSHEDAVEPTMPTELAVNILSTNEPLAQEACPQESATSVEPVADLALASTYEQSATELEPNSQEIDPAQSNISVEPDVDCALLTTTVEPVTESAKQSEVSVATASTSPRSYSATATVDVEVEADVGVTGTHSATNLPADDAVVTEQEDEDGRAARQESTSNMVLPTSSEQHSPTIQLAPSQSPRAGSPVQSLLPTEGPLTVEEKNSEETSGVDQDDGPCLVIDTTDTLSQPQTDRIANAMSPAATFVAATVLQAQANLSRPQSAATRVAPTDSFSPKKTSSRPASASPQKMAEAFVGRTVSQAQINLSLSGPQSAVTRNPSGEPFTPHKASERPASASPQKMAEAFVGRTVSQAQINVVMGSPTRGNETSSVEAATVAPEPTAVEATAHKPEVNDTVELPEPSSLLARSESSLKIGEDAMVDHQGSSSVVLDGAQEKSTRSVAYDEFLSTLGLATPSADSKKAAQLRAMVEESRDPTIATASLPVKKLTKKEQQEADRTFLTSLQYHPPPQQTKKIVYSNSATNVRPSSSRPQQPVTKRDLLRGRSAGPNRAASPAPAVPPPKAGVPKRKSLSPSRLKPPKDHRTQFVAPPLCLPSQMMPKDLVNYLFASGKESELKISLFCQHGRHFATCKADLCVDAHEKYRWLNLVHQKAKEACELVSDADFMWREKLEKALVKEIAEKKGELQEELSELSAKLNKRHNASVKLLKQGVRYYESILPALHSGKVTPQELYKATGWTEEHYENFRRRLQLEEESAHFKRKQKLDQLAHKHLELLSELQSSLTSPMMYLDGMLKHRLEKIHSAVKRIDMCFQYSIKLAIGIGKGKSEEELKAETEARSPMRNAVMAERMQRTTKHGFEILKASLASIADVCSEVRVMYQGIKRTHDLKQEKRIQEAAQGKNRSRSPSPAKRVRSPCPNGHKKQKARPKSAPNTASPERRQRPSSRPKSQAARSATARTEKKESGVEGREATKNLVPHTLDRASKMSYGEDFEPLDDQDANENNDEIGEESMEIHEGTYEEEMDEMMRDMMGEDYASKRPDKAAKNNRSRTVSGGDSSIVEDCASETSSVPRTQASLSAGSSAQGKSQTRARPSTLSVGSAVDDFPSEMEPLMSEKVAVLAKARAQALAQSPSGKNYTPNEDDEIESEEEDELGFGDNDNDGSDPNHKVSVSNMYDDDFVEEDSLMRQAFTSSSKKSKKSSKKHSRKKKSTSQKVAQLMNNDPLVKPLTSMKASQMNDQSILHGILLANNIPIHYTDEPELLAAQKLKPLIITNTHNQPVVLSLTSPKKARAKSADPQRPSSPAEAFLAEMRRATMNPRTSMINSSWNLPLKMARGELRCFHCQTQFPAGRVKFLPSTAVSSDPEVFEVAKARQKNNTNLLPTFEKIQVTSNTEAHRRWIFEQQEKRQEQLAPAVLRPMSASEKKTSITHQRSERPFCSWECVKAWCHINIPPQQKYQNDLLIDVNAGYKVVAKAD